jgi:hypothetical protein
MPIRSTVVQMAGCLLAFGAAMVLARIGDQGLGPIVLAVVLAISLPRQHRHAAGFGGFAAAVAATVLAGGVGWLLAGPVPVLGDVAFVLVVAGAIAVRRFGPTATSLGVVATMPMIGLLVVPVAPRGPAGVPVLAATAVVTVVCVGLTSMLARRTGFLPAPAAAPVWTPPSRPERRRLQPADRMALQMAIGLAAAFVVGRLVFGPHWSWVALTAYVVAGGARSRGDVLHRGLERIGGAAAGTTLAALAGLVFAPGSPWPVVAIFVVLAVASWLRQQSYAWWAAGVTTIVALLAGFLGQDAAELLPVRLLAIVAGGALAVAAAWFVLPIRTSAIVRRRVADALAVLQDLLAEPHEENRARFTGALERLGEIAPSLRAHRRLRRLLRRPGPHAADTVDALLACADAPLPAPALVRDLRRGLRAPDGHLSPAFAALPRHLTASP